MDYIKTTKVIGSQNKVTLDEPTLKAAGAEQGDTIEIQFKVVKKRED